MTSSGGPSSARAAVATPGKCYKCGHAEQDPVIAGRARRHRTRCCDIALAHSTPTGWPVLGPSGAANAGGALYVLYALSGSWDSSLGFALWISIAITLLLFGGLCLISPRRLAIGATAIAIPSSSRCLCDPLG